MCRSMHSQLLAIFILGVLCLASAAAQERKGTITGRVMDPNHAVLQGARVEIQPKGLTVVSDGQGNFTISSVAPGQYTVTVSAIGFAPFSKVVEVGAAQVISVDATLAVGAKTEVVEVRAERQHGEIEALNRERTADNIVQVLPSEVITSLPNTNIADAVGRLPSVSLERDEGEGKYVQIRGTEPRLSNVTVDGVHLASPENVRNVKLDAIPADLVESVEVSKTLSANQEGEAIGGSVNLVTKSAGDRPYVSLLGMGGYTPIAGGRSLDQFDGTIGNRFGKDKRLGIMFGGSYDWNARGIDDQEPVPASNDFGDGRGPVPIFTNSDTREYWYDRTRFGYGGTLDYKLGDWSSLYLRGIFSQFKDDGQDWIYTANVGNPLTQTTADATGNEQFTHVTRKPSQRLFNMTAGARHAIGNSVLTYDISLGQARQTGFFPSASFNGPSAAFNTTFPAAGVRVPTFTVTNGVNIFDPTQYTLNSLSKGDDHTYERDIIGNVAFLKQYSVGSHASTFEIGFRARDGRKSELNVSQIFNQSTDPAAPLINMSGLLGTFTNSSYYFGKIPLGPVTNYQKIIAAFTANPTALVDDPSADLASTARSAFDTTERVTAGYVMNTINLGRVRLQAGVRIEGTQGSFLANSVPTSNGDVAGPITQVPGSQSYVDVLPSVQFQYRFGDDTILRAAYGIGIARPNFSDLPPFIVQTLDSKRPRASLGNPNLLPTHAQNFDLLMEKYLKPVGVIQAGVFYKFLTDPIFSAQTTVAANSLFFSNGVPILQTQPINGPSAHLFGFEMAWQQQLRFLPGLLNGAGVRANYSYTNSDATFAPNSFGGRTDHVPLQRQAPSNWNFDTTYDKKGLSARMGLTHNDANIFQYNFAVGQDLGPKGPNGDVYLYPHTQLDAQVSYWIPKGHGFQVVASGLNLTNEVFGFYQGSEKFPIQREYYNRTVSVGLRWTLAGEPK